MTSPSFSSSSWCNKLVPLESCGGPNNLQHRPNNVHAQCQRLPAKGPCWHAAAEHPDQQAFTSPVRLSELGQNDSVRHDLKHQLRQKGDMTNNARPLEECCNRPFLQSPSQWILLNSKRLSPSTNSTVKKRPHPIHHTIYYTTVRVSLYHPDFPEVMLDCFNV